MSSISGIGYRVRLRVLYELWRSSADSDLSQDFTLGPSKPTKSRSQLDRLAYEGRRIPPRPPLSTVPSLQSICISLVADNFGSPGAWDQLDRFAHLPHVPAFIDAILAQVDHLPFGVWSRFASVFGQELPPRRRTYRGLCVSDDQEIATLKRENEAAVQEWAQATPSARQLQAPPTFFLAVLDLAHDTTFSDADLSKLRGVAPLLAALKLDYTRVTDDGLGWMARHADRDGCYQHLEVLSLKGLRKVTEKGVLRLSKLRCLRMLGEISLVAEGAQLILLRADLRETACTKRVKAELSVASRTTPTPPPPWAVARYRQELERIGLELELFGPSFSLSRTLTYLHSLAYRFSPLSHPSLPSKPLCIHIDAISRQQLSPAPASAPKSAAELYDEQMGSTNKPASTAYNQTYGAVTSTVPISRRLLEESGMGETEKGAAFRHRNDAIAGGSYVGPGKTGGRSLFDVGQRKLTVETGPLSDTEEELEKEEERRAREEEATRVWDAQPTRGAALFYRPPRPLSSNTQPREIKCAEPSDLILLRHLPYHPPYDITPTAASTSTPVHPVEPIAIKRREPRRDEGLDELLSLFSAGPVTSTRKVPLPSRVLKPSNPFSAKKPSVSRRPVEPPKPVATGPVLGNRPLNLAPIFDRRR